MLGPFWMIRHKLTGAVMDGVRHRGYTQWEPHEGQAIIPRLFHTEAGAKIALSWWLKGESFGDYRTDWDGEPTGYITTRPVPSRKREDMEIIKVEIKHA